MPPRQETERIHALDALRAVAMFLGIVLHAGMVYTAAAPMPGIAPDVSRSFVFDVMILVIHSFRMQLFFLLAGFFGRLVHQRLGTNGFIKQRLKRIGLPFLLAMLTIIPLIGGLGIWAGARDGKPMPALPGVPTLHLWFLLYLLYLYAIAISIVAIANRFAPYPTLTKLFDAILTTPLRLLVFPLFTAIFLWIGPWWGEPALPIYGLLPKPMTLLYHGTFFAIGWLLHPRLHLLTTLKSSIPSTILVGAIALSFYAAVAILQLHTLENELVLKCLTLLASAVATWSFTFAAVGIFLRFFPEPRPLARYLADASYWCYLAHVPIVIFFQIITSKLAVNAFIKFSVLLAVTMAILLITYEYTVRYTWIGKMLNGPRQRAKLDCGVLPNKEPSPAS